MQSQAKIFIVVGVLILAIGLLFYFFGDKLSWIGNLPGDIKIEKENFRFYFPITTMILVSIAINLLIRLWRYING